jgi:hypothetical protein
MAVHVRSSAASKGSMRPTAIANFDSAAAMLLVRQSGIHPDEARDALTSAVDPARALLQVNPELQLHHMHDPNQDRRHGTESVGLASLDRWKSILERSCPDAKLVAVDEKAFQRAEPSSAITESSGA